MTNKNIKMRTFHFETVESLVDARILLAGQVVGAQHALQLLPEGVEGRLQIKALIVDWEAEMREIKAQIDKRITRRAAGETV